MSSALAKFRKSNKDGDINKAAQKVADPKKDTFTRLKHLKTVLGKFCRKLRGAVKLSFTQYGERGRGQVDHKCL